ncbi:MAG: hypothetical protein DRJ41_04580 [Thermoprotei archaeon]|nr:MAG: hypothetical protein DRJ41_04580 [Thermoprotei archaeon]
MVGLKLSLVLEIFLAGIYLPLTSGVFLVYLSSLGYGFSEISLITALPSLIIVVLSFLVIRKTDIVSLNLKRKFILVHAGERITWFFLPFIRDLYLIMILYLFKTAFSAMISVFMNYVIYGSFPEEDVRDITAKRSAAGSLSSIFSYLLATVLIGTLPPEKRYFVSFFLGASIGLFSTLVIALQDFSKLEGKIGKKTLSSIEKVYSASLYHVLFVATANMVGMVWTPFLVNVRLYPQYIPVLMGFTATFSSMLSSLYWRDRSFRVYRTALLLDSLTPLMIWVLPTPPLHIALSVYNSFVSTGAGFLGGFLFARYLPSSEAILSASVITMIGGLGQGVASLTGIVLGNNYPLVFMIIVLLKMFSLAIAYLIIPEVAFVPEDVARSYSTTLYRVSLIGFNMTIEYSKETVITTFKMVGLTMSLLILYIIYRLITILVTGV